MTAPRRHPRPPQPRRPRRRAGDPRLADAGHLHPRRPRRPAARPEPLPGDAADLGDHPRLDALGAAALQPDAGARPARRLPDRRRRRRHRLGALRARAHPRLLRALPRRLAAHRPLHVGAGLLPLRRRRRRQRGLPPEGDLLGDGRRPRLGDPRPADGQADRRRARPGPLRRRLCRRRGAEPRRRLALLPPRQPGPAADPPGRPARPLATRAPAHPAHRGRDDLRHGRPSR